MREAKAGPRLLNGINVSRELDAGKGAVVDRAGLPRAYFARRSETATGKERLRDLDPADTVLIEGAAAMAHDPSASAQITAYTGSHYGIRAKTASASYLTIAVPDFPGWVASMDGKAARVLRANHALMAVLVPAGEHQLTLDYQPSFLPGLLLSLAGLVISASLIFTKRTQADVGKAESPNSRLFLTP